MTVSEIQRALVARGYDPGPIDGDPGAQTIAAVTAFQTLCGLVPDGIAGPLTQAALAADQHSPTNKAVPSEPAWLVLARADLGTVEGIGASSNPKVVGYFRDAGFPGVRDDAVAWCAAFAGAELARAGHRPSGSLAARSYERWGVGLAEPALGAVGVKRRGGSPWQGHVGFVVGASRDRITLLGGNQGDAVSIAAFPRAEFTAFRWPTGVPLPSRRTLTACVAGARAAATET